MGKSFPEPDERIGEAALLASQTGADYLTFMQDQADITNEWALEDRAYWENVYKPIGTKLAKEASNYDTPERREAEAAQAAADVTTQFDAIQGETQRSMAAMGVDPNSGRYAAVDARMETDEALAQAGAQNMARRGVEDKGRELEYNALATGMGYQVNPATSIQTSNNAVAAGAEGAMSGYSQAADMYNMMWQQEVAAYNASMSSMSSLASGIGQIFGAAFFSSKDLKEDKKPAKGVLDALRAMPVEEWKYKKGVADEGRHIGPYAEDFQKATGKGDGKTIAVQDAVGVTMGAVKELDATVQKLAKKIDSLGVKDAVA